MKRILIIGADRVMPKLFYFAQHLRQLQTCYTVYTHDSDDTAKSYAAQVGAALEPGPPHARSVRRMLRDLFMLWRLTGRTRFAHAEMYSDYHILASLGYFLVLHLRGIPVVLWCRGELYEWEAFRWWQRLYFHLVIPRARLVILKETYMRATLEKAGVRTGGNLLELHNTVPLPAQFQARACEPPVRLLFMNMFKAWRNVSFCADLAVELRRRGIAFTMSVVGEKTESGVLVSEGQKLRAAIALHGLQGCVSVHPFSSQPVAHYDAADVFLLPANLIYCNYALLEAMSHGLVPLVNSGDADHSRIIDHGVNGFGLSLDAAAWADAIQILAQDRSRALAMSAAARHRIECDYSTEQAFERYCAATGLASPVRAGASSATP
jgi:glycosyltransferase involved in cell wall biosynthesis